LCSGCGSGRVGAVVTRAVTAATSDAARLNETFRIIGSSSARNGFANVCAHGYVASSDRVGDQAHPYEGPEEGREHG